jgi:hypothetical protein
MTLLLAPGNDDCDCCHGMRAVRQIPEFSLPILADRRALSKSSSLVHWIIDENLKKRELLPIVRS